MRGIILSVLLAGCTGDDGLKVFNTEPVVSITTPPDGSSYLEGEQIRFEGRVQDGEESPEQLLISWYSDIDGSLLEDAHPSSDGIAELSTANLSPGNHIVTLSALDSDASSGSATVALTVEDLDDEPEIAIAHPLAGEYGIEGQPFEFSAIVADEQDEPADLLVSFASDLDGVFCEMPADLIGQAACAEVLSVGEHALIFTVTDTDELSAEASVFFEVISADDVDDDHDGYSEAEGDCNDGNPAIHPAAEEIGCNDVDEDCDGRIDEDSPCADDDGDGYTELYDDDCDDSDPNTYPGAPEACDGRDNDCDGQIDEGTSCVDDDGDGLTELDGDCDDADASVYPGAPEEADGVDDDCDGLIDEGTTAYDDDGDCFCELGPCMGSIDGSCSLAEGDCNDGNAEIHPDATEVCDLVDNDCNEGADEDSAVDASTWYEDLDGDGYGTGSTTVDCWEPAGYAAYSGDCDDSLASVYPGAVEACDGLDNDCDASIDEGVTSVYYQDADGDGYGNPSVSTTECAGVTGYVANDEDCNDSDPAINPDTTWYLDADGDGYGTASSSRTQCSQPSSHVLDASDCNDGSAASHPGATETCSDALDNDCDGSVDEAGAAGCTTWYLDNDGDGYGSAVASPQCTCSASSPYDVLNADDCYDYDAAVKPGASGWYTSPHGGGTYDYNCDGTETREDTTLGGCHVEISWSSVCDEDPAGWDGSAPACGATGNWIWDCHFVLLDCEPDTTSEVMACR